MALAPSRASRDAPTRSPSQSPMPALDEAKQQQKRVLACVLCQQRKVRCNRTFPCNNCIRMGAVCVPATLNPRRSRRRFPERELLDRVRRYESLLRQHNVRFESLFQTTVAARADADADADADAGGPGTDVVMDADADAATAPPRALSDKGSEAKHFWKVIRRGFRDGDNDDGSSGSEATDAPSNPAQPPWGREGRSTGSLCFPRAPGKAGASVTALHPAPAQIVRLWQIYLDNVDPLLKVTHTPSLQGRIVEAAGHLAGIDAALEALLFGIYCVAVHSLAPADCRAIFAAAKADLLATYHPACEQALLNCGFLQTRERDCLTAFFLYTVSLGAVPGVAPASLYAVLGVAVRLGVGMQIHNEASAVLPAAAASGARLPPLEAEMRRRLWWAMALFDARVSELANHSPSALDPAWDCAVPRNASDVDWRAGMAEPPAAAAGRASEAIFAVVRSELANGLRHMASGLAVAGPGGSASPLPALGELDALEAMVHEKYLQHCDPGDALHFMTVWTARGILARRRLAWCLAEFAGPLAAPPAAVLRDVALEAALVVVESDTQIVASPRARGFCWLLNRCIPLPAYAHITQELAQRLGGDRARCAWAAMSANYAAHAAYAEDDGRPSLGLLGRTILQAWDACEARSRAAGTPLPVPDIVARTRRVQADTDAGADTGDVSMCGGPGSALPGSLDLPPIVPGPLPDGSGLGVQSMGWPPMPWAPRPPWG